MHNEEIWEINEFFKDLELCNYCATQTDIIQHIELQERAALIVESI